MRLYDYLDSGNGYKIRLLLSHLRIAYELVPVDILKGKSRTREFLRRNPNGRIPVLELEDGTFLAESNAILFLLSRRGHALPAGGSPGARAGAPVDVLRAVLPRAQHRHLPLLLRHLELTEERRRALVEKKRLGEAALAVMAGHLASREFFVAGRYSIADIALYAYTHVADQGGFDLGPFPSIRGWLERVRRQPGHVPMS
jgi:glutathione S-transferase